MVPSPSWVYLEVVGLTLFRLTLGTEGRMKREALDHPLLTTTGRFVLSPLKLENSATSQQPPKFYSILNESRLTSKSVPAKVAPLRLQFFSFAFFSVATLRLIPVI